MTSISFAEFVSTDVRVFVLKQVERNAMDFKFVMDGEDVAVRRARTRRGTERNTALRGAATRSNNSVKWMAMWRLNGDGRASSVA